MRSSKTRVLVLWADEKSPNLGVRALAAGADSLVKSVWPDAEVEFQSFGSGAAPYSIRERTLLKEQFRRNSELRDWMAQYDLVLDMRWGDSFSDIYGLRRLVGMNALAKVAADCGVPIILGPQTIGPFKTRIGRLLGRRAARMSTAIIARDEASLEYCRELGLDHSTLGTDVVFAIPVPRASSDLDVALNVSGLLWESNPHVDYLQYRQIIYSVCRELLEAGREVTLFAHVLESEKTDNDVPAVEQAKEHLGNVGSFHPQSLEDLRQFVAGANVVVGARMHACLNALSVGTPAIAMAYSRKFEPLLSGIGWAHTIDLRNPDGAASEIVRMCAQSDSLVSDVKIIRERVDNLLSESMAALERSV